MFVLIELSVGYKPFPLFYHKHKKNRELRLLAPRFSTTCYPIGKLTIIREHFHFPLGSF